MDDDVAVLSTAPLTVEGRIASASNATLLAVVDGTRPEMRVIYKPRAGERPLWDFPTGTLCQREVAAYAVSDFLGWGLVPPTVLRDGPFGTGSVQRFVEHDPREHYFALVQDPRHAAALTQLATFDLLVNNADRKGSHVLLDPGGRIRGCDHGLCFHAEPKLRTVVWEFAGMPVAERWRNDLRRLRAALADQNSGLGHRLARLLSPVEVGALATRAEILAGTETLPDVDESLRPYPWPPL